MSQLFITNATRHFFAIDGGNTEAPPKRTRLLFHPTQTVVAVGADQGVRRYDIVPRDVNAWGRELCPGWEPA